MKYHDGRIECNDCHSPFQTTKDYLAHKDFDTKKCLNPLRHGLVWTPTGFKVMNNPST